MPNRNPSALTAAIITAALALLFSPTIANAASPPVTRQATTANAGWLAYAPPPAGGARALCLVDTGVNTIPDTAPGLVSAIALDLGTGNDTDPLIHGTIDAAIAGGAGHGVLGAWPQLKILSVRATDVPTAGQRPTYQYDDYVRGMTKCTEPKPGVDVAAIDIALSSVIPPTPDQSAEFADAVSQARTRGISILAAAGNEPGPVQLPGSQPGVLAVGAGSASGGICSFSASTGLTFFAPGCGLDQIDTAGNTFCCGNGTSQASAFAAGVLVALRSYNRTLSGPQAVDLLVSTARHGHLDAAAAFRAAGLGAIVDAGSAAMPKTAVAAAAAQDRNAKTVRRVPRPSVRRVTWRRGVLQIVLKSIAKGARLRAKITFARRKPMYLSTTHLKLRARTPPPRRAQLRLTRAGASSATVTAKVTRLRR